MFSLHALLDKVILQMPKPRSITPEQRSGINQCRKDRHRFPQKQIPRAASTALSLSPDQELRLYLDPHHVGRDLQAGRPAQGVQEVTVTHLRGVHGQMVHVAFGGRQNPQDPPQDQEVVLKGTGFLNKGTVGKISTEKTAVSIITATGVSPQGLHTPADVPNQMNTFWTEFMNTFWTEFLSY